MATSADTDALTRAWGKIIDHGDKTEFSNLGRAGYIPVYDENMQMWRLFRSEHTIYEGAETALDPVKVDGLRQDVIDLVARYPRTIEQLEKLGLRVKRLLNSPIKDYDGVTAWSTSIFNVGPMLDPEHVFHTSHMSYDDFNFRVQGGRNPVYVVPAGPRGSGNAATVDFTVPGMKRHFGPRHEYSKLAFVHQTPQPVKERKIAPSGPARPRGRPRADGLSPGSEEAKAADVVKRREARRAARAKKRGELAPVIPLASQEEPPPPRRRLARLKTS